MNQFTKNIFLPPSTVFLQVSPGQPQNIYTTAWKITKDVIYDLGLKSMMKVNAYMENIRE